MDIKETKLQMSEQPRQSSYGRGGIYLAYSDTERFQDKPANENEAKQEPASKGPFVRQPKPIHIAEIVELDVAPPSSGQQQQQRWQRMTQHQHTGVKIVP